MLGGGDWYHRRRSHNDRLMIDRSPGGMKSRHPSRRVSSVSRSRRRVYGRKLDVGPRAKRSECRRMVPIMVCTPQNLAICAFRSDSWTTLSLVDWEQPSRWKRWRTRWRYELTPMVGESERDGPSKKTERLLSVIWKRSNERFKPDTKRGAYHPSILSQSIHTTSNLNQR